MGLRVSSLSRTLTCAAAEHSRPHAAAKDALVCARRRSAVLPVCECAVLLSPSRVAPQLFVSDARRRVSRSREPPRSHGTAVVLLV